MKNRIHSTRTGFSLVVSLIILTLLSILVVSFITTTGLERTTARAFANKALAEATAETGVNQAISLLAEKVTQYPDAATVWEALTPKSGGDPVEGTVLYFTDGPNNLNAKRYLLPLLSRGTDAEGDLLEELEVAGKVDALGQDAWNDDNSIDLNRPRFNGDTAGWIGSPPPPVGQTASPTPKPFRARWIEVKDKPANTDPASTPPPGSSAPRTIGRYAFWVEDESFKVNLNHLGAAKRWKEQLPLGTLPSPGSLPASPGAGPEEVPIQGLLRSARAQIDGTPLTDTQRDLLAADALKIRTGWFGNRLFELRAFNQAHPTYNLADETKFLATIYSGGLDLSRHGSQRLNLNGLGFDRPIIGGNPPLTDVEITKQIRQVVETIKFHAPKFGQRFYRASTATDAGTLNKDNSVPANHETIYLHKVAANIRDYIDPDSQPTLIRNTGTVERQTPPALAMSAHEGANDYWAQGKDGAPFLQETVVRFRSACLPARPAAPGIPAAPASYTLKVDYYIEFWNMTDRDIYAAPQILASGEEDPTKRHLNDAFVKVADPVGWFGHGGGTPALTATGSPPPGLGRDVTIKLSANVFQNNAAGAPVPTGVVFKAGACTVITTDPDDLLPFPAGGVPGTCYTTGGRNTTNTYYCKDIVGLREFTGPVPAGCNGIWPQFRDLGNPPYIGVSKEDYGTEIIFGNDLGYLDSHPYTISKGSTDGPFVTYIRSSNGKTSRDDTYGGTLFGNGNSPSQLGDPRTNNEQLAFTRWKTGGVNEPDQTRYFNPTVTDNYRFSLGWPNSRYVFPSQAPYPWKDYYKVWSKTAKDTPNGYTLPDSEWANSAPAVIANEKLKSIGQLGDIFDPVRARGNGSSGIEGARGGGRTFKIGQRDGATVLPASPGDLVDMSAFHTASQQWAAWRMTDFFSTSGDLYQPGLININGLRRDNGAALRAACYGPKDPAKNTFGMTLRSVSQTATAAAPTAADRTLDSEEYGTTPPAGMQRLINQAIARLNETNVTKPSYFRERGEISELELFSSTTADVLTGVSMSETFDHSREELARRLMNLITTRGSVFTVYAVGQSITEGKDLNKTQHVTGEHWMKATFALLPRKADGSEFRVAQETFDPTRPTEVQQRFAKPDHYDIQLLQVSTR